MTTCFERHAVIIRCYN